MADIKDRFLKIAEEQAEREKKPAQLTLWPDEKRGAPNALLRSALFSASKPINERKTYREHTLAVLGPYSVKYTGPQLYQPELDVWLELVHRCRLTTLGNETEFQVRSFLRALRRSTGKSDYKSLVSTFHLLSSAVVEVSSRNEKGQRRGYIGHLIDVLEFDEVTARWKASLNPKIAILFAPDEHTWLAGSARLALGRSYLAKWLHGYYATHRKPLPISVERLRELSGSANGSLRDFRRRLRDAFAEVARVELTQQRSFQWQIDADDMVVVSRS